MTNIVKRFFLIAGTVLSLAAMVLSSCTKGEEVTGGSDDPAVTIETLSETLTSVSFKITATNASQVAYTTPSDLSTVPSARAILAAGYEVPESGEITVSCTPGQNCYVAAAARSESGKYSEVATLILTAGGTACEFVITTTALGDDYMAYTVSPSDETVQYVIALLEAENYPEETTDEEIFNAIKSQIEKGASEAGKSFEDYLSGISFTGNAEGANLTLTPEKGYVIVAVGISNAGEQTTLMERYSVVTTPKRDPMVFDLSVTNITNYCADLYIDATPSNTNYWFICDLASKYPDVNIDVALGEAVTDVSTDLANAVADSYIKNETLLAAVPPENLYRGSYDMKEFELVSDTKYYFFAFAYEQGIGRRSDCKMIAFSTKHGFAPEELAKEENSTLTMYDIGKAAISFEFIPIEDCYGIMWMPIAIPTAEYSAETAQSAVQEIIKQQYDVQVEHNASYTMADAANSVCYKGKLSYLLKIEGLNPDTDYTLAVVPVAGDGYACAAARTYEFTTKTDVPSKASVEVECVGVFYGGSELSAIYSGYCSVPSSSLYLYKVTAANASACKFKAPLNDDYTDPTKWPTDDDLSVDEYLATIPDAAFDGNGVAYIAFTQNPMSQWGFGWTLLLFAEDADGVPCTAARCYTPSLGTTWNEAEANCNPLSELTDLISQLGRRPTLYQFITPIVSDLE